MINTTVLVETLNWSKGTNDEVKELFWDLMNRNRFISLTDDDYFQSLRINKWYDNSVNFSDCTIIKTMLDLNITKIVTFDNDFKKAGFEIFSRV